MSGPPTIFPSCDHSKYLVYYCIETNCWESPPKQHRANVPIAVCQVVGIWPHKRPHHISAQPQPRRAKKDCQQDVTQANTFVYVWLVSCFFDVLAMQRWAFGISIMFTLAQVENKHANLCRMLIYPLPCPFQKQQSPRCWKRACLFLVPGQAAGHYGHPGGRCGCVARHNSHHPLTCPS